MGFFEKTREPSGKKMHFTNRVGSPPERKCNLLTGSEALRKENAFYEQIREPHGKKIQFTNKTRRKTNGPQTGRTGAEENGKKWLFRTEKKIHGKKLKIRIKKIENTNGKIRTENGKKN